MNRIATIILVWIHNEPTWHLTQQAIRSLGDVDLYIIDNASDEFYHELLYKEALVYVKNKENLGYAKAVNQGLKLVPKGLVAIANNDIRLSPNWQEIVREAFKVDPAIYSVHPRMVNYDVPFKYGNKIVPIGKERWCTGSFFVINHDPDAPILYDENFLNSCDDWDYFKRVRQQGLKTCFTNMCAFQHEHSFTQKQIVNRDMNDQKNREYYKQKHGKYPEEDFEDLYPGQLSQDYWKGFE